MRKSKINLFEMISALFLLFTLILILLIAASGNHKIFLVLVGLFPTILTIILSLILHEQYNKGSYILWILPILTSLGFYALSFIKGFILGNLDVPVLTGINFLISIVYVLIVFGVFKTATIKPYDEQEIRVKKKIVEPTQKQNMEDIVHSIEDKSKALNFVVGRVYNKYHGGTSTMREKLRIPSEWYNEFSLIGFGTKEIDYDKLQEIIDKFKLHLNNFEKTEKTLFKKNVDLLKNLIREPDGREVILDVLDHNDKDPIRSYYEGAVKFCKKITEQMKQHKVSLIENKYIPKTDEEKKELQQEPTVIESKNKSKNKKRSSSIPSPPKAKEKKKKIKSTTSIRPKTSKHP